MFRPSNLLDRDRSGFLKEPNVGKSTRYIPVSWILWLYALKNACDWEPPALPLSLTHCWTNCHFRGPELPPGGTRITRPLVAGKFWLRQNTLAETSSKNSLNMGRPPPKKTNFIFQPLIFRRFFAVGFRKGIKIDCDKCDATFNGCPIHIEGSKWSTLHCVLFKRKHKFQCTSSACEYA